MVRVASSAAHETPRRSATQQMTCAFASRVRPVVACSPLPIRLASTCLVAGVSCAGGAFAQQPVFSAIEPFLGARYGMGYDTSAQAPARAGQACVDFDASKTSSENDGANDNQRTVITRSLDLVKKMNLSAEAQVKSLTGQYEAKSTLEVADKSEVHRFSETKLFYSYRRNDTVLLLTEHTAIKPEYQELLKKGVVGLDEFRAKCGNAFIVGQQTGEYYYGTSFKSSETASSTSTMNLTFEFAWTGGVKATGYANYARQMDRLEKEEREEIRSTTSNQKLTAAKNPADLEKQWSEFVATGSGAKMIKAVIAPYSVAKGALPEGVLGGNVEEKKLEVLLEGLWDLKSLKEAAQYVLRKPDQFALGLVGGPKRQARLDYVRKLHQRWRREFDALLTDTKACINKFTDECLKLANEYESNPRISAETQLPKKYRNLCYQRIEVRQAADTGGSTRTPLRHSGRGDTEMGGGPVKVNAVLLIEPAEASRLIGRVLYTLEEDKKDHTTFKGQVEQTLFDLAQPVPAGLQNPFEECQLASAPIASPKPVDGGNTYGIVAERSGRDPRGHIPFPGRTGGLLREISCEVDTKNGDNGKLNCEKPSVGAFTVSLVNKLDVEAERWTAPFDPADRKVVPAIKGIGRMR